MEKAELIKLAEIIGHYEGSLLAIHVLLNDLSTEEIDVVAKSRLSLHIARALKDYEPTVEPLLKRLASSVKIEGDSK